MRHFRKTLSEITLGAGDFLNARFRSNRSASPLVAGPKYPAAREEKSLAHAEYWGRRPQSVTLGSHSIASRLTSSEKFIMKINQLFCIQLIYGTWSRFRPRANFAICSICCAISLATFTIELFSSSHLSVSSCSSWAANYKTSNKTSTIPTCVKMNEGKTLLYFFKVKLQYFYLPLGRKFPVFFLFKIASDKIVQHWAMPRKFNAALIFQGHPTTVFYKISVRRNKYCLEFSTTWGRLKIST